MKIKNKTNFWLTESILKPWHNPLINPIFSWKKNLNKFKTKRGLKRKILWVEVNDEGNGKKTKKNCLDRNLYSTWCCWADHFHCFSPLIVSFPPPPPSVLRGLLFKFGVSSAIYCTYERLSRAVARSENPGGGGHIIPGGDNVPPWLR